jgi:hypothetical protein
MVRISNQKEMFFRQFPIVGIIHCQILEGKYDEAKQQIEFQHEVQAGNAAVSERLNNSFKICFLFLGTRSFESASSKKRKCFITRTNHSII